MSENSLFIFKHFQINEIRFLFSDKPLTKNQKKRAAKKAKATSSDEVGLLNFISQNTSEV